LPRPRIRAVKPPSVFTRTPRIDPTACTQAALGLDAAAVEAQQCGRAQAPGAARECIEKRRLADAADAMDVTTSGPASAKTVSSSDSSALRPTQSVGGPRFRI
jgi:hypothetical protein